MPISPTIYTWSSSIIPNGQLFHEGGQSFDGGFTSKGMRSLSPEPGGRAWLEMEFGYQSNAPADPRVSWQMSKLANGHVFLIPLARSPQLVPPKWLGLDTPESWDYLGKPWANDKLWANGFGWRFDIRVKAVSASSEGTMEISFDMGNLENGLRAGHVIGHGDVCYKVDDIEYDGSIATVLLMRPLRRDVTADDMITFRPMGMFTAENPESFRALYRSADLIRLGSIRMMEALV